MPSLVTMTPAVRTGRACFDHRRLPRDEFVARARAVDALALDQRLSAVVVVANAATPGPVVHLTNYAPTAGVATVVLVPGHDPVLIAGRGGRREEPYQRDVTWVPILHQQPFGAEIVQRVLAERGVEGDRLGVAGLEDQVPARAAERFVAELGPFELVTVDDALATLRRDATVRESSVLGEVDAVLGASAQRGAAAFARHANPTRAALAIEDAAYARGCRDVRLLVGHADGSLRPFEAVDDRRQGLFVCYVAAEYLGYWGERAVTFPWAGLPADADLRPVVDAVVAQLRPGARPGGLMAAHGGDPAAGRDGDTTAGRGGDMAGAEVDLRLRGLGVELVELPDDRSGWVELRASDPVSVVASRRAGGAIVLHSRAALVGPDGPVPLARAVIGAVAR